MDKRVWAVFMNDGGSNEYAEMVLHGTKQEAVDEATSWIEKGETRECIILESVSIVRARDPEVIPIPENEKKAVTKKKGKKRG